MGRRNKEELRAELTRLMQAHTDAMKTETFGGLNAQQLREQEERLGRIREVSNDFLVALKGDAASSISNKTPATKEKPSLTLPGKVEKIIESPHPDQPDKAQISIEGADSLYREIRVENTLMDKEGNEVALNKGAEVDVTIEVDNNSTSPKPDGNK